MELIVEKIITVKEKQQLSNEIYLKFQKKIEDMEPIWHNIPVFKKNIEIIASSLGFLPKIPIDVDRNTLKTIKGQYQDIGYSVQFGNKEFFLGDMIKFQHLYNQRRINEALYICMTKEAVKQSYSTSLVTLEESVQLIKVFSKIFTFPIYFLGIDKEDP